MIHFAEYERKNKIRRSTRKRER